MGQGLRCWVVRAGGHAPMISGAWPGSSAYDAPVRRPAPPSFSPVRRSKQVAIVAVLTMFVAGMVAILATHASIAHVGTLLVGCVALGAILASALDRRRAPD